MLWGIALLSVGLVIVASATHFHSSLAFTYAHGAFSFGGPFWGGLGAGLLIGIYDYLGYNTSAYLGAEVKDPGRTIPRSIVIAVIGVMVIYLLMNIGVLGVVPWREASKSESIASLVLERTWGKTAADITTVLILFTAFGSVFAGLLGGSRVPYNAARDGLFLKPFARLHPRHRFPHVALLVMGVITAIGSFFDLATVIQILLATFVFVQGIAQIVALTVLRRRQPELRRPYKQWLYPSRACSRSRAGSGSTRPPARRRSSSRSSCSSRGSSRSSAWARAEQEWPFGTSPIREEFLATQGAAAD